MGYVLLMNIWSVGQGVKTPPFHGGNTGSNPVRGTNSAQDDSYGSPARLLYAI